MSCGKEQDLLVWETDFRSYMEKEFSSKKKELSFFLKILFIFIFREGRKGERGRETSVCGCLSHASYWGPGLQPRHVS